MVTINDLELPTAAPSDCELVQFMQFPSEGELGLKWASICSGAMSCVSSPIQKGSVACSSLW